MKPHQIGIVVGIVLVLVLSGFVVWRAKHMLSAPAPEPSAPAK